MKVKIDKKTCIGCLMCTSMAEEIFEIDEDKDGVKVKVKETVDMSKKENQKKARESVEACPVEAIKVLE